MEIDLSIRLHAYATTAEGQVPLDPSLYTDALACSAAASASASAGIICSHTRVLRGDSRPDYLLPGQDELDVLVADKPTAPDQEALNHPRLPLRRGSATVATLALGASGIPVVKSQNA